MDRARGTDFVPINEVGAEGVGDRAETFFDITVHLTIGTPGSHGRVSRRSTVPSNGNRERPRGAGKEIRTPDLLITTEPAPNAVLPDETPGHV